MLFGLEDLLNANNTGLVGAISILAGALYYLVKRHEERLDKKDAAHQERMSIKDAECAKERSEHREERQEEAALNRDVMKGVTSAVNSLTAQLNYRGPNRNSHLPQG